QATAQATVTAGSCPASTINSFAASPNTVTSGGNQTVRLSWNITDNFGTGVTVTIAGVGTWSTAIGSVDIPQPQSSTTYTLTVTNGCGNNTSAQTTVTVNDPNFNNGCGFRYARDYSDSTDSSFGSLTEELNLHCDFPTGLCFGYMYHYEQDSRGVSAPTLPTSIQPTLNQLVYYFGRTNDDSCWDRHLEGGVPPWYVNSLYTFYNKTPASFPTQRNRLCNGQFWGFDVYFTVQYPPNMTAYPTLQVWGHNNKE